LICKERVAVKPKDMKGFKEDIRELVYGRDLEKTKDCLPPCNSTSIHIKRTLYNANVIQYAGLNLHIKDQVEVLKDVHSYDFFNLVVDLGSALGLWLGLSAMSIFDLIVLFVQTLKTKFTLNNKKH
jgi:hypothetical protein